VNAIAHRAAEHQARKPQYGQRPAERCGPQRCRTQGGGKWRRSHMRGDEKHAPPRQLQRQRHGEAARLDVGQREPFRPRSEQKADEEHRHEAQPHHQPVCDCRRQAPGPPNTQRVADHRDGPPCTSQREQQRRGGEREAMRRAEQPVEAPRRGPARWPGLPTPRFGQRANRQRLVHGKSPLTIRSEDPGDARRQP